MNHGGRASNANVKHVAVDENTGVVGGNGEEKLVLALHDKPIVVQSMPCVVADLHNLSAQRADITTAELPLKADGGACVAPVS